MLSGVYDLVPIRQAPSVNTGNALHLNSEQEAQDVSPAHRVRASAPVTALERWNGLPVVVAVGAIETDEFRRQSRDFAARLGYAAARVGLPARRRR